MTVKSGKNASPAMVRRLTKYLSQVQLLSAQSARWVSSSDLAEALDLTSATVRRDLMPLDCQGTANRGYEVEALVRALAAFLGADTAWNCVVVGAGNLGKALALHGELPRRGFRIRGIFDTDGRKVGTRVGELVIQPAAALPLAIRKRRVDIAVIAVPAPAAQAVADLLIVSGIRGLLNLSLTHLSVPRWVSVVDGRLVASMLELAHAIKGRRPHGENQPC